MGEGALSASSVAKLFFDNVVRFFGVPGEISSRYPRFTAYFLVGAVGFAGDQTSDEFCLPSSDRWADKGTHRTLEQTLHCLLSEGGLDGAQWYSSLP